MNKKTSNAILLLSCPDRKGIVAEVSHFIFANNGNIIHSDQHTDTEAGVHFMRVEWDLTDFDFPPSRIARAFAPLAEKFRMDWELYFSDTTLRTAIFVSKLDHCLYDLLWRIRAGELPTEVVAIVSNHPDLKPIADFFQIPFHVFEVTESTKREAEQKQLDLLNSLQVDLVVLARYMQILSPSFIASFQNRVINIHHSFLPAFSGSKPYQQAFQRGVKLIGATSHYATDELDQGPIIEQDVERVTHRDNIQSFIEKGKNLEKKVLGRAVKLHLQHKVLVYNNKTMILD